VTVQRTVSDYALGDSPSERRRIDAQAERLRVTTQRFLLDAGVRAGMHVLELGSGTGEVSAVIAELVGAQGAVVGLERSESMLAQARVRTAERGLAQVQFLHGDLDAGLPMSGLAPFDALVGRFVLTHLADPVAVLRTCLPRLRSGAVVAFQEVDFTLCDHLRRAQRDRLPLVNQVCDWIEQGMAQATTHRYMGLELHDTFRKAGLPAPTVQFHTEVYGGVLVERIDATVTIVRNLLPRLARIGVSAEAVDIDTLGKRLLAETLAADAVQARASIASAWATKP
jgi:ubiquinone/menaquinone biosynthesis C-methylase UbiE